MRHTVRYRATLHPQLVSRLLVGEASPLTVMRLSGLAMIVPRGTLRRIVRQPATLAQSIVSMCIRGHAISYTQGFLQSPVPTQRFDASQQHSLRDLPSDLIVLVEVWETGIHWLEPRDIDVRQLRQLPLNGPDGTGCLVLFADGTLALLDANTPLDLVHTFCTISGAKSADRGELLGEHIRRVWSSSECVN